MIGTRVLSPLVVALLIAPAAVAQTRPTTADVTGVVYDQQRAVLQTATVTATNTETNQVRSVRTDDVGRFALLALPPGVYTVRAESAGFASQTQQDVVLRLGTEVVLEFILTIASTRDQVTVFASAGDTFQTAIASVVTQEQINALPINGRNFISFAVITPGVTNDNTPQQGASATSGLTFSGQRARSNNITVDGLDNNDIVVGSVRATFSQEAVREFQVITNSYTAEYGKASGGVVNIVTKSGTNVMSGNAFFFFRDAALNSKEYFERFTPAGAAIDRPKAPYRQNQFGGILGGPIKKDTTFFFASFERLDVTTSNFVNIDDTTLIPVPGQAPATVVGILERSGFPVDTGNVPYLVKSDSFLVKLDHDLKAGGHLALRYDYADGLNENIEPWGGLVAKSRGAALDSTDGMFSAAHTAVFQSKWVNEARFQFARRDQEVNSLDPNCGGPCTGENQGGPTLEILGVASVGRQRFTPQPRSNDRYQVLDTLSLLRGNHQLKVGVDFNYVDHKRQALPLHFGGRYLFGPLPAIPGLLPVAINGIQALALGIPSAYIQGYGNSSVSYGYSDVSLFAQDDWRPTGHLVVKFGVRYQNQFWPATVHNTPGIRDDYPFPRDNNNVAPRVAVSWDPTGSKQTSVHAAYGVYYDNIITSIAGIVDIVDGSPTGVRTLAARLGAPGLVPRIAWNSPGHVLSESAAGSFPSLVASVDPDLETAYAHHLSVGLDRELAGRVALAANYVYARGFNQLGTVDYNPVVPSLGAGRRPLDVGGVPGTSASVLQYTGFGETWYHALIVTATRRVSQRWGGLASYTLSNAKDSSTDFQSTFLPQDNGRGRDPADSTGLPLGFDPGRERGPSLQDRRHNLVLSGMYVAPYRLNISTIMRVDSGRPYNILAGVDLNGDGNGGAIPGPDRALRVPGDLSSSIGRNLGTLPAQVSVDLRFSRRVALGERASIDAIVDVFNLFNRANFTDVNNIFGVGAYPTNASATFGQFQQAGPPRQAQLAVKVNF
jgi:Carboxypeptidase regulatory-like domain